MKAGVVTFPGSNCDDDAHFALSHSAGFQVERLWHKSNPDLSKCDLIVVPGGFSYGDYLRCGAIAAASPIMTSIKAFAGAGGFVIGICNGFQILCEAGLLPGALTKNSGLSFLCQDVDLVVESSESPWTGGLAPGEKLTLPIAHGDGRYVISPEGMALLRENHQVLLTYAPSPIEARAGSPIGNSPNGSLGNIAGICNENRNVFGLMPHPERATEMRSRDGMKIWSSVRAAIQKKRPDGQGGKE